jgi:hypothetical protein
MLTTELGLIQNEGITSVAAEDIAKALRDVLGHRIDPGAPVSGGKNPVPGGSLGGGGRSKGTKLSRAKNCRV